MPCVRLNFELRQRAANLEANFNGIDTYNGSSKGEYRERTVPIGSFGVNKFGLHDVHGNVMEWVEDCSIGDYRGVPSVCN